MENYLAFKNEEEREKLAIFRNPLRTLSAHRKVRDFLPSGMLGTAGLLCFLISSLYSPKLGVLFLMEVPQDITYQKIV